MADRISNLIFESVEQFGGIGESGRYEPPMQILWLTGDILEDDEAWEALLERASVKDGVKKLASSLRNAIAGGEYRFRQWGVAPGTDKVTVVVPPGRAERTGQTVKFKYKPGEIEKFLSDVASKLAGKARITTKTFNGNTYYTVAMA